jgi:Tfp pilus assembly protein PilO
METQLDLRSKILLCVMPFIIAIAVVFCLAVPQYNDYSDKNNSLESRKKEQQELQTKLADSAKVQKEKKDLEKAIASLRSAVPKTPDHEVLYIDLEKLCMDSGLELLAINKGSAVAKKEDKSAKGKEKEKEKDKSGGAGGAVAGLVTDTLELKLCGSYKNLMTLVDKIEHYQRVVAISMIHMGAPAAGKGSVDVMADSDVNPGDNTGDPDFSHIKLTLTTYYLP